MWALSCFSRVWLFATLWTVACQVPLSTGFSRQEYWSGLPFPPPGNLPYPGIELTESPTSSAWQVNSLLLSHPGSPSLTIWPSSWAPWYLHKGTENSSPSKNVHMNAESSFIHNCHDLEATKSFSWWMDKWKWESLSRVQLFVTHGLYSPWNPPGQNNGVGSLSLLQGIFPT